MKGRCVWSDSRLVFVVLCLLILLETQTTRRMEENMLPKITTLAASRIRELLQPIRGVVFDVDGTMTVPGIVLRARI